MKDNYMIRIGEMPAELFEKIEDYTDIEGLAASMSQFNPSEEWRAAKENLVKSLLLLIIQAVEPERRNMETLKEYLEMERVPDRNSLTLLGKEMYRCRNALAENGLPQSFLEPYERFRRMPEDVKAAIVTEVKYMFGLAHPLYICYSTNLKNPE